MGQVYDPELIKKCLLPEKQLIVYCSVGYLQIGFVSTVIFKQYTAILRPLNGHDLQKLLNVSSGG